MKKVNSFLLFTLSIFLFTSVSSANSGNKNEPGNSTKNKLKLVFESEISLNNKIILKLYDDEVYEFLHFTIKNKKPKVIREKGFYSISKNKLKLKTVNSKKMVIHPKYYYFSEKGLYESKEQMKKGSNNFEFKVSNDKKYFEYFYIDSVFGKVSNNKSVCNKLDDPKLRENQKELIEPIYLREETDCFREYEKAAFTTKTKLTKEQLNKIKVVMVVGNDAAQCTNEQLKVNTFLLANGIKVTFFYSAFCEWEAIKKASEGAHIFIYAGHGITLPSQLDNNTLSEGKEGTLFLKEGIIDGQKLVEGLRLHKNALVLFNHACSSAGSSADDNGDIGITEATRRVVDYAKPFVKLNVGSYYANNRCDYLIPMLTKFFYGVKIQDIYNHDASEFDKIENRKLHPYNNNYEVAVSGQFSYQKYSDGSVIKAFKTYDAAYVGVPNFTVNDFFK
jgi:hypothetical protein